MIRGSLFGLELWRSKFYYISFYAEEWYEHPVCLDSGYLYFFISSLIRALFHCTQNVSNLPMSLTLTFMMTYLIIVVNGAQSQRVIVDKSHCP